MTDNDINSFDSLIKLDDLIKKSLTTQGIQDNDLALLCPVASAFCHSYYLGNENNKNIARSNLFFSLKSSIDAQYKTSVGTETINKIITTIEKIAVANKKIIKSDATWQNIIASGEYYNQSKKGDHQL